MGTLASNFRFLRNPLFVDPSAPCPTISVTTVIQARDQGVGWRVEATTGGDVVIINVQSEMEKNLWIEMRDFAFFVWI